MSIRIAVDGLYAACKNGDIDTARIIVGIGKFNKIRKKIDAEKKLDRFHSARYFGSFRSRYKAVERILRTYEPRERLEPSLRRQKKTVQHLSVERSRKGRYDHIVDRRQARFHKQFPKKRTGCGKQKTLIKIKTVRSARIEIERTGIRVRELIDGESILIELPLAA